MQFFNKIKEKFQKKPKIYHKKPKIFIWSPKHWLKSFLLWLRLRDMAGELIVKEETNIDDILRYWNKALILWIFNIFFTGFLLLIPLTLFVDFEFNWKLIFTIFALGMFAYVIEQIFKGFIKGLCQVASSFPKR